MVYGGKKYISNLPIDLYKMNFKRNLFVFLLINVLFSKTIFPQNNFWKENEKTFGLKTSYGVLASHRFGMGHLQAHVPMVEVNFNILTKGQKEWHHLFRYPALGIYYVYAYLGHPEIMGSAHAIMPYMQLPIIKLKRFEWNYRFALGAAYLSKHFDPINNIENIAIGSSFNIAANLLFDFNFRINESLSMTSGIGMTHFSNANLQTPNLGINIPAFSLGINYRIGDTKPFISHFDSLKHVNKKFCAMIFSSFSLKAISPHGSPFYPSYTLSTETSYKINKRRSLGFGTDWIYDQSLLPRAANDINYGGELNNSLNYKAGINISETLLISKFQLSVQMGVYILRKYNEGKDFYNRFAFRYNLTKHLIANLSLRTHLARADCIEWGLGVKL
jgi:hypothetical protein